MRETEGIDVLMIHSPLVGPVTLAPIASQQPYRSSAEVYVVCCGMHSDEMGERLSPAVEAAMPTVIDAVAELVTSPK